MITFAPMESFESILKYCDENGVKLLAVSKTKQAEAIFDLYQKGQRDFGENKVQELISKKDLLPADIRWHLIGHLQSNKVKFIAPFVHLIHSVDSFKLIKEINKQALLCNRTISCLLQIFIATEETKFGLSEIEATEIFGSKEFKSLKNICVVGLMGMASNTSNENRVRSEFSKLKLFFDELKKQESENLKMQILSMGMSSDYKIAIKEGSTMIRIGSALFGAKH